MVDQWEKIFQAIINIISALVGSCANFLIIISFFFYTPVKEATERFLVSLSVADFLTCTIGQLVFFIHINESITSDFTLFEVAVPQGAMMASLHGLLAVTVDRFVSIYLPFKYVYWMNDRNVCLIISASWILSVIVPILFSTKVLIVTNIILVYRAVIFLLVPLLYCIIFREARKQARLIKDSTPQMAGSRSTNKATKGVGLVLATTVVSWLPLLVFPGFAFMVLKKPLADIISALHWCVSIACLNSSINPFLYYWQFSKFRRSIRKMIHSLGGRFGISIRPSLQTERERQTCNTENKRSYNRRKSAWPVAEGVPSDNEPQNP